jgi:hypothetical protein
MKYSDNFNRDFKWFIKMRNTFDFGGRIPLEVKFDINGIDFKKAFHIYDSTGILKPTKHPIALAKLLLIKGGVNLHAKMYAEDRGSGLMGALEFRAMCIYIFKSPDWFRKSVEQQKFKYGIYKDI